MAGADNDYPVLAESEGIKIKTEKMVISSITVSTITKFSYFTKMRNHYFIAMRFKTPRRSKR